MLGDTKAKQASVPYLVGKLLGHDGKPMPMAHVTIAGKAHAAQSDGAFRIKVAKPGIYAVIFTGVDHGDYTAKLLLEKEEVDVQILLGTYEAPPEAQELSLVQIRFQDNGETALGEVRAMIKEADGKYRVTVTAKSEEFAYEIRGMAINSGRSMNGSARTAFRYDGDGNYCNVVQAETGPLVIVHDPSKPPPAGVPTTLQFSKANSRSAALAAIFAPGAASLSAATFLASMESENDPYLRQARTLAFFANPMADGVAEDARLVTLARTTLETLATSSELWMAAPTSIVAMASVAGPAHAEPVEELFHLFLARKNKRLASEIALGMLIQAATSNDEVALARFYGLIQKELRGTQAAKVAKMFNPARKIRMGKTIPSFLLTNEDGPENLSNQTFAGKILLIDFWATWCRPCIEELPNLHATYEKFHSSGFEILSINVDDKAGRARFMRRTGKFPMPWSNATLGRGEGDEMKRRFEVEGLPTMILVDGEGKILGTDFAIRGPALGRQVAAALASAAGK